MEFARVMIRCVAGLAAVAASLYLYTHTSFASQCSSAPWWEIATIVIIAPLAAFLALLFFEERGPAIFLGLFLFASWIVLTSAASYATYGIDIGDGTVPTNKWDYLYFSVVTFTTLGYGDFRPCPGTRVIAAIEALAGFMIYPVIVTMMFVQSHRE